MHPPAVALSLAVGLALIAGDASAQPVQPAPPAAPPPARHLGVAVTGSLDLDARRAVAFEPELYLGDRRMLRLRLEVGQLDRAAVRGSGFGIAFRVGELGPSWLSLMLVTEHVAEEGYGGYRAYGVAPGFARIFSLGDSVELRVGCEMAIQVAGNAEVVGFGTSYRATLALAGWQ